MSAIRTLFHKVLCGMGLRSHCPATPDRSEIEGLQKKQREILVRVEALGVNVDVRTRRYADATADGQRY